MSRQYEDAWKLLLKEGKLSIRCLDGLETATLIRAIGKEKNADKKHRDAYRLKARVDRKDKNKVNFELRRRINILEI